MYRLYSTIQIANQRFIVHLHPPEEGISCEACSIKEDRSNLVPLLEDDTKTSNTSSNAQSVVHQQKLAYHSPMDEKTAKTFTKEEKRQNFRSNMQSLRKNLLAGGNTSLSSNSSSSQAPNNIQGKSTSIQRAESVESSYVGNSGGEESNNATSTTSIEAPKYVDRAKLRRSIHPPQHGLSDADPPHHQSKRFRLSSPSSSSANMSMSAQRTEPNYGPGAALFQKMMTNGINSNAQVENTTNLSSDIMANDIQPRYQEVKMGKVIEVKTMADRNAGLGSGTIREGVEQHSNSTDWKDAARQRRWREANR